MHKNGISDIGNNLFCNIIYNRHTQIAANPQKQGKPYHHQHGTIQKLAITPLAQPFIYNEGQPAPQ